jgi:hypothetical protein
LFLLKRFFSGDKTFQLFFKVFQSSTYIQFIAFFYRKKQLLLLLLLYSCSRTIFLFRKYSASS